jgi:nucleolar complex protein 2
MGPPRNLKATKKFQNRHLKGVLERRKAGAKVKQRHQLQDKRKARAAKDREWDKGRRKGEGEDGEAGAGTGARKAGNNVGEMSVDDFFSGGFDIIDKQAPAAGKGKAGGKLGKRKRGDADEESSEADSSEEDLPAGAPLDDDDMGEGDEIEDDDNAGMSKEAMAQLEKDDPEFHQFLKDNDPELLDFDEDADLAEIDELSDGGGEDEGEDDAGAEEPAKKKRKKGKKKAKDAGSEGGESEDEFGPSNELTRPMVAKWKQALTATHSLRAARQVVLAFRSAAHLNQEEEEGKTPRYSILSPEVFHDVLVVAMKQIPEVLQHHVPAKETSAGKTHVTVDSKKFKTLSILIKSHTASILHLLGTLSDDATLKMTLSSLEPLLPYLLSFRKLLKALIRTVVNLWSQPSSSESTRIAAFLVLRRLCVTGDKGVRETVLKAAYQGLVAGSRTTNANTMQGINLMKTSAAELWGIDAGIGYTTAFTFIRQLAIHLRNSIVNNANEAYRKVYNWQYVHSLDFWSCVLSEQCNTLKEAEAGKESQLRLLIYPLTQVSLGAMNLIPTATYFPLRFHVARSLLRLSRGTGTYIPLATPLLEVLNSAEMRKAPRPSTLRPLDFGGSYKCPKTYLRSRVYQDGVGEQVVELMGEYCVQWCTSIAFPEFALPVVISLKRWLKEARGQRGFVGAAAAAAAGRDRKKHGGGGGGNKNSKLVSSLAVLVQRLEANAKFVEERRAKVDFAPKDRTQVDAFLRDFAWEKTPLGAYVVGQRKTKAERTKMLEVARREDERKRKEEKREEAEGQAEEEEEEEDVDLDLGVDEGEHEEESD